MKLKYLIHLLLLFSPFSVPHPRNLERSIFFGLLLFYFSGHACSIFAFTVHVDSCSQRTDGSKFFDIYYTLESVDRCLEINILPITTITSETLLCETFIELSDTGIICEEGEYHIIWDIGSDEPGREFYTNRITIEIIAAIPGIIPGLCYDTYCFVLGGDGFEPGLSLGKTSDSAYAISTYTSSFGASGEDMFFVKFNSDNSIDWAKIIRGYSHDQGRAFIERPDGSLIVSGITRSVGGDDADIFLTRLTSEGDVAWIEYIDSPDDDFSSDLIETNDNGYALAGWGGGFSPPGLLLIKSNSTDSIEWARIVEGIRNFNGKVLVQTPDSGFVAIGNYDDGDNSDICFLKFSPFGIVELAYRFGGPDDEFGRSFIQADNGSFFIFGTSYSFSTVDVIMVKLDSLYTYQWTKAISQTISATGIQTGEDEFVITGSKVGHDGDGYDIILYKINNSGELLWASAIGDTNTEHGRRIIQTGDGDYIVAGDGFGYAIGSQDIIIAKFTSDGISCCARPDTIEIRDVTSMITVGELSIRSTMISSIPLIDVTSSFTVLNADPVIFNICPE